MAHQISEADWKLFRQLRAIALERFCQRVLAEVARLSCDTGTSNHARYQAVFKLMESRDQELADTFDDVRRSTAWRQLASIQSLELLTEEEFARFSPETRGVVTVFLTA